jgi:predicted tellurium resistance membrane protein TerC
VFGLILSIALMGLAATFIARLLQRQPRLPHSAAPNSQ